MVAYCEVGVRVSLFALLHEVYTGSIVPMYDGSLTEWGLQHDLPMELDEEDLWNGQNRDSGAADDVAHDNRHGIV